MANAAAGSGRIRRSVRFAQLDAQTAPGGREFTPRRERITVTDRLEMPSFQNTQDWTGGMGISPSGRFQVAEGHGRKQRPFSRKGIRQDWARVILWILAAILSVVLLVEFASIGASSLRIQKLKTRIENARVKGEQLQRQLAEQGGDISVVTRAVEMNLISSSGATTIELRAPSGATLLLVENQAAEATAEPDMRASLTNTN